MIAEQAVNAVGKGGDVVALKDELRDERSTIVRVAHCFSQQEWVLDLGVIGQAKMAEHVVKGVLEALQVIYDIFVEHGATGDFAGLKLTDLVTDEMHGVDLSIDRGLGLGNLVTEA